MKYQCAKTEVPNHDPSRNGEGRREWRMKKGIRGILEKSLSPLLLPVVKTGGERLIVTADFS